MGTEIRLEINGLTVDWSKNQRGVDHGALFQEKDRKSIYESHIYNDETFESNEMAFSRSLKEVLPRLELLGFTLEKVKQEYLINAQTWEAECLSIGNEGEDLEQMNLMTFDEYCLFVKKHPLNSLDDTYDSSMKDKNIIRGRFEDETETQRIPYHALYDSDYYSEKSYFSSLLGFLHPYSILRLLAENTANLIENVEWKYGQLVENGWAFESEFTSGARRNQTFLVATEGSSDVHILKHALSLLRPEIEDFFRFIDVSERHPFSGTGNLLKFAEGLAKIDVHNQVIFLFDNDAEGFETYKRLLELSLPDNMCAMFLPELDQFRAFLTQGPEGESNADINKRGAAIECYLDLNLKGYPPAKVIWTNYKKDLGVYHGALEYKDSYMKAFLNQTPETIASSFYDVSKLHVVLEALVIECRTMATKG